MSLVSSVHSGFHKPGFLKKTNQQREKGREGDRERRGKEGDRERRGREGEGEGERLAKGTLVWLGFIPGAGTMLFHSRHSVNTL